jgi:hypothetical protein
LTTGTFEKFVDRTCGNTLCVEPAHLIVRTTESRFWQKVDKTTTPDSCWPWLGGKHTFGYGSTVNGSAHRIAYELERGAIPDGAVIRHLCHNPVCYRPDHLACGTQYENIHDAIDAGRMRYAKGERAGFAKFSDVQAAALREVFTAVRKTRLQNASLSLLATLLDVTPRTVWRIVKGRAYKTVPTSLIQTKPRQLVTQQPVADHKIEQIRKEFRQQGFPWSIVRKINDAYAITKVTAAKVIVDQDVVTSLSYAGQKVCLAAHAHRLEAKHKGQPSVVEAYNDDQVLVRALRYQLGRGDPVTPKRVLRALMAFNRAPRNFPPALARWLVDEYAPVDGVIFDPCSGYGGRLLGALASTKNVTYIGHDIELRSVQANLRLAQNINAHHRTHQHEQAVEDTVSWPTADLVITGPPYYDLEDYGPAARTYLQRYRSYEAWRDGFLRTLVTGALTSAPTVIINVARTAHWDLPADVIAIAVAANAYVSRVISWPLQKFGKQGRTEKLIVLQRTV